MEYFSLSLLDFTLYIDCVNNDGDDEDRSAIILLFFDQKLLHVGLCLLSVGVKHHNL